MRNDKKTNWADVVYVSIIGLIIIIVTGLITGSIAWVNSPTKFVVGIEMDNNTLEATRSLNTTIAGINHQAIYAYQDCNAFESTFEACVWSTRATDFEGCYFKAGEAQQEYRKKLAN